MQSTSTIEFGNYAAAEKVVYNTEHSADLQDQTVSVWIKTINNSGFSSIHTSSSTISVNMQNVSYARYIINELADQANRSSTSVEVTFTYHINKKLVVTCPVPDEAKDDRDILNKATIDKCQKIGKHALVFSTDHETVVFNCRYLNTVYSSFKV